MTRVAEASTDLEQHRMAVEEVVDSTAQVGGQDGIGHDAILYAPRRRAGPPTADHYDGRVMSRPRPLPRGRRTQAEPLVRGLLPLVVIALLAVVVGLTTLGPASPAAAADTDPDLVVSIDSLRPSVLRPGDDITLSGSVQNRDDHAWTKVQAYLVISKSPYTSREDLHDVVAQDGSYTGTRIVEPLDSIAEVGTLTPGGTGTFTIKVPHEALGLTGGTGVYPVGVQILATDSDGKRSTEAVGRATTLLPGVDRGTSLPASPTGLVWPFLMPDFRGLGGTYEAPGDLVASVTDGQLRHLLDLAASAPRSGTTVVVDPALLLGVEDLLEGRHVEKGFTLDEQQRAEVTRFRDDLASLARTATTWVLGFDRPDVLGIADVTSGRDRLLKAVDRATSSVLTPLGITGRRVSWPLSTGVTQSLLASVRDEGTSPVIVTRQAATQWSSTLGSVVQRGTTAGSVPLLVSDSLDTGLPGVATVTTLRQRALAESVLASVSRTNDPSSRADSIGVVSATWDPGPVTGTPLDPVFRSSFAQPSTPEQLLTGRPARYTGDFATSTQSRPVSSAQLSAAASALGEYATLDALVGPDASDRLRTTQAVDVAGLLGVRWRDHRTEGTARADRLAQRAEHELSTIQVKGPPAFTLSSNEASFPLTISNRTRHAISVGVRIDSTTPALQVPGLDPVDVGPDERLTVNVPIDVGNQSSSTLSAQLVTPTGRAFGEPAVFNVRSSRVATTVWLAMGAAGVLVVLALGRRFLQRRKNRRLAVEGTSDD